LTLHCIFYEWLPLSMLLNNLLYSNNNWIFIWQFTILPVTFGEICFESIMIISKSGDN
jgi:hypothetical protein